MESAVRQIKIIRVGPDGTGTAADDELISEKTVSLYVDGRYDHAAVITGGGEKLWAAGNLKCRGLISSADDIEDISVNDNIIGVRLKRRRVPLKPAPLSVEWQVGPELVRQKIAELAQAKLYLRTGCLRQTEGSPFFRRRTSAAATPWTKPPAGCCMKGLTPPPPCFSSPDACRATWSLRPQTPAFPSSRASPHRRRTASPRRARQTSR